MPISRLGYVNNGTKKEFPVISALPREMTMADFVLLSDAEKMGDIIVTDYPVNEESDYVEVVADGVKTYSAILDELYALVDTNRLNEKSCLVTDKYSIPITYTSSNTFRAIGMMLADTSMVYVNGYYCVASGSKLYSWTLKTNGNTITDNSNAVATSGTIFRLYYNDAHTFDFNTKAENCIYGNSNVKDALDDVLDVKQGTNNLGVLTIENVDYPLKRSVMHLTNISLTNNKAVIALPCQGQDILSVVGRCWATTGGVDYILPLGFNDGTSSFQIYGTLTSTNATVQLVLGGTTTASDIVLVIEHV